MNSISEQLKQLNTLEFKSMENKQSGDSDISDSVSEQHNSDSSDSNSTDSSQSKPIDLSESEQAKLESNLHKNYRSYARISKVNNNSNSSLMLQLELCFNYIKARGGNLLSSLAETRSSYNKNSKDLCILLRNKNNTIIFTSVDRFSRNIVYGMELVNLAKSNKNHLVFLRENLIITDYSINQIQILNQYLHNAEQESRIIGMRVKARIDFNKLEGKHSSGRVPYGYRLDDNKYLIHDDYEMKIKKFIIACRTAPVISKKLNELLSELPDIEPDIKCYKGDLDVETIDNPIPYNDIAEILNGFNINKRTKPWDYAKVKYALNEPKNLFNLSLDDTVNNNIIKKTNKRKIIHDECVQKTNKRKIIHDKKLKPQLPLVEKTKDNLFTKIVKFMFN